MADPTIVSQLNHQVGGLAPAHRFHSNAVIGLHLALNGHLQPVQQHRPAHSSCKAVAPPAGCDGIATRHRLIGVVNQNRGAASARQHDLKLAGWNVEVTAGFLNPKLANASVIRVHQHQ